jgi:hypothetical protein
MMETLRASETSVYFNDTIRRFTPESWPPWDPSNRVVSQSYTIVSVIVLLTLKLKVLMFRIAVDLIQAPNMCKL